MSNKALLQECVFYFKSSRGFTRVFEKAREKYRSLGRIGGTIVLNNPSALERDALTGLLKKDCSRQKSITVSLENLQKSLEGTKFKGLMLEDVLAAYFGEVLVAKKSEQDAFQRQRDGFFAGLMDQYSGTPAGAWLEHTWKGRENVYRTLILRYDAGREELRRDMEAVCRAVNNLPCSCNERLRLPVFASRITKNPHAFDEETGCGQLLLYALGFLFNTEKPQGAEKKAELYYGAGILVDEVSNYVLCRGLRAYDENGLHPGWEGFYSRQEPVQATLSNLGRLKRLISPLGRVYAFENPAVFMAVSDNVPNDGHPLVCTYGQVKIASLVLFDMLAREDTRVYYSGDFDPEGLLIADRLKARYGEKLILWRYSPEDYESAVSDREISVLRMKKLDSLKDETLLALAESIRRKGCAGYQELLIDLLVEDIRKFSDICHM